MIRLKRARLRPESTPEGAQKGRKRHLRLVPPAPEASEDAAAEEEGGRPRRASSAAYEDPHAFVRTCVDPRNIYLA